MGGGGSVGDSIAFPNATGWDNPTAVYSRWITHDSHLKGMISDARTTASPYDGETAPDPDDYMDATATWHTQGRLNALTTVVDAFAYSETDVESVHTSERSSIESMIDKALEVASDTLPSSILSDVREAYEKQVKRTFMQSVSRMAASMADINAVNSSAFIFGLSNLERQMMDDVDRFTAGQGIDIFRAYVQAFIASFNMHMQTMVSQKATEIAANHDLAAIQTDANRLRHAADLQEHRYQMTLDAEEVLWDFKLYQYGANMLSAAGGAQIPPAEMSTAQGALSGALSGAGMGAKIGSATGIGTGLGAGIGAVTGLLGGLFK